MFPPLRQSQAVRVRWDPVGVVCWFASSDWKEVGGAGGRSDRYQARGSLGTSVPPTRASLEHHSSIIRGQEVESSRQGTEGSMDSFSFFCLFSPLFSLFPFFLPFFPFFSFSRQM